MKKSLKLKVFLFIYLYIIFNYQRIFIFYIVNYFNKKYLFFLFKKNTQEADRLFRILMGEDVPSRKHFILTHAKNIKNLDI